MINYGAGLQVLETRSAIRVLIYEEDGRAMWIVSFQSKVICNMQRAMLAHHYHYDDTVMAANLYETCINLLIYCFWF